MIDLLPGLAVGLALAALLVLLGILQVRHMMNPAAGSVEGNIVWYRTYPGIANYIYAAACAVVLFLSIMVVVICIVAAIREVKEFIVLKEFFIMTLMIVFFSFLIFCLGHLIFNNLLYYIRFSSCRLSFNRLVYRSLVLWSDIDHIELESSGLSMILLKNGGVVKFAHGYAGITQFYDMALLKGIDIRKSWA